MHIYAVNSLFAPTLLVNLLNLLKLILSIAQVSALLLIFCPKSTVKVKQSVLLCALLLLYYYFPVLQITAKTLKNDKHSTFMQSTAL